MIWSLISFLLILLFPSGVAWSATEQRALLELKINEIAKGELPVIMRDDDVLARVTDLQSSGLKNFAGSRQIIQGVDYVSLKSLMPEVTFQLDERDLSLRLSVHPSIFGVTVYESTENRPPPSAYRQDTSGFFNYAVGLHDLSRISVFTEAGVNIGRSLLYSGITRKTDGMFVRGLSNLTMTNRESLNRTVIGDRFSSSDLLGGNPIIGGISFLRDFNLDPYLIRQPGFNYSGAVATPSTADMYVNGRLVRRIPLAPGQFELKDLPVSAGNGETRIVVRDALGREQEFRSQDYFTSGLLKEGLHEYNYSFGMQRNKLSDESWDYGPLVFLGHHRLGISRRFTAGLRFEAASSGILSTGPTVTMALPIGEVEIGSAISSARSALGGASFLGYNHINERFSFGTLVRFLSPHYANTSLHAEEKRSWMQLSAVTGIPISSLLNLSLKYTFENSQTEGKKHQISFASTSQLTNRISWFVSASHSRESAKPTNEIITGLSFVLGETSATVSYGNRENVGGGTLSLQKSLPLGVGYGYRVQADTTQGKDLFNLDSMAQYQGPYGRYEANYSRLGGQNSNLLSVAGGLAMVGGKFYVTQPVQESFAVIQVPGVAGVRGYLHNNEVGRSDATGNIFVSNLLSYYGNKLSISDKDIPLNYTIDSTETLIAPEYRGGVLVEFPVHRIQRVSGRVLLQNGSEKAVPLFGQLTVQAKGKNFESPIGKDGGFYLENVPSGRHKALLEYKDTRCGLDLEIPESEEQVIKLGTFICGN